MLIKLTSLPRARVKTALLRLEKIQRAELVKMRNPFIQHIYKVRHLVEIFARKLNVKSKIPL